jgi:hypothetical protein
MMRSNITRGTIEIKAATTAAALFALAGVAHGQGACCANDGSCTFVANADCLAAGGIYRGDGVACGSIPCGIATVETEGNDTKATANTVNFANPGDYIRGNTIGSDASGTATSADMFLVKTPAMPLGVYRHRLTLESTTPGYTGTIHGLNQIPATLGYWPGAVGTPGTNDVITQTTQGNSNNLNQWYGFGKQERIYYNVAGTSSTTADYVARWSVDPVTPTDLGTFAAGTIAITTHYETGNINDTDLWVYDANFNAIDGYGNDGESSTFGHAPSNSAAHSWLQREYVAGTYYLALTDHGLANNKCTPCDDFGIPNSIQTSGGNILDFSDAVLSNANSPVFGATTTNLSFQITDGAGATTQFPAARNDYYEIKWYRFTVAGTATTGACCRGDGTCQMLLSGACNSAGGVFQGTFTTCATASCPQPGACCKNDGTCAFVFSSICTVQSGTYQGAGVTCAAAQCNQYTIVSTIPGAWTEIADTGTTFSVLDPNQNLNDGSFPFTSSVTNALVADPNVHVGTNGNICALSERFTAGALPFNNPSPGTLGLFPFSYNLDDNYGSILHDARVEGGVPVEIVEWNQISRSGFPGSRATFEVKIWGPGGPALVQYIYLDVNDVYNGNAASVGVQWSNTKAFQYWLGSSNTPGGPIADGMVLSVIPGIAPCYANCDGSTTAPILNVADFTCFLQKFAAGNSYANCDGSTQAPVLNVADFTCFLQKYAAGCQ